MERRTPYQQDPLRLKCVAAKSTRVATNYRFGDTVEAEWSTIEMRALSDGKLVYVLSLKEDNARKVQINGTYIFKNLVLKADRAYFKTETVAFKSYNLVIEPDLVAKAEALLCPPSPYVEEYEALRDAQGYITIKVQIVSVPDVRQVLMKGTPIPIRDIEASMAGHTIAVTLWREVSLLEILVGDWVTLTHLRASISPPFGFKLNTSTFTEVHQTEAAASSRLCTVVAVNAGPEFFSVMMGDGAELKVPTQSWVGTEEEFSARLPMSVTLEVQGDLIVSHNKLFETDDQEEQVDSDDSEAILNSP
nr:uncharacterized protein LOC129437657 [Misgurnus anguillicaudatus]